MRSKAMVIVAALAATITIGATACSSPKGATVAGSASATNQVQPSSPPAPGSTTQPASSSTSGDTVALARSTPVRVLIPAIGVDSGLMDLGLGPDGSLEVPPSGFPAGWYTGGPTPGELGPAIITGHIDWKGPGVFHNLPKITPGDQVTVTRADGSKPTFRVTRVAQSPKDQFPTKLVYGNIAHPGLRLITCGGSFNSQTGHYEDNIVVFADLIATTR